MRLYLKSVSVCHLCKNWAKNAPMNFCHRHRRYSTFLLRKLSEEGFRFFQPKAGRPYHPAWGILIGKRNFLGLPMHPTGQERSISKTKEVMENLNLYRPFDHGLIDEHKRSFDRTLRRLRIALGFWLISFIATMIWFALARQVADSPCSNGQQRADAGLTISDTSAPRW